MSPCIATFCRNIADGTWTLSVDGAPLSYLVAAHEARADQEVRTGSYSGISVTLLPPGAAHAHFLGSSGSSLGADDDGRTLVLMCECGEAGCWPLTCRIEVSEDEVIWHDFRNPQRPALDYSGFGPFAFSRAQYEDALRAAAGT